LAEIRSKYPKAYEKWSENDDRLLEQEFRNVRDMIELSKIFKRQPGAVKSRLAKLGLIQSLS
jgi:hypothetical protein